MRFGTSRHALCIGLVALYCQASLASEQSTTPPPAPQPSVKRDCADAKGATKKECEKVAAKIDAQAANPQPESHSDQPNTTADYVHHSSPAMRTPKEAAQDKANAKADRKTDSSKPEPK